MAHQHSFRGLEIRKGKYQTSIRINFRYQGIRCKETLPFTDSERDIAKAMYFNREVRLALKHGTFNYETFFPKSKKALRFRQQRSPTIGKLLDDVLDSVQAKRSHATYLTYKKRTELYLRPQWGSTEVTKLTSGALKKWIESFPQKKTTIAQMLIPLRKAIKRAFDDEIIDADPFARVTLNELVSGEQKQSDFDAAPFTIDEIYALLDASRTPEERGYVAVGVGSGLRPQELKRLEWGDVDLRLRKVYVPKKVSKGGSTKVLNPKRSARAIDMRRGAMEAFETLSRLPNKHERYVFIDPTNGEPWQDTDRLRLRFRALCAKAGVRYRNPYQTRHTFASTLLASGKPSFYVQTQMGHSSLKMIEERYARWIDQGRSKQSRMKLDAFFSLDDDVDATDN